MTKHLSLAIWKTVVLSVLVLTVGSMVILAQTHRQRVHFQKGRTTAILKGAVLRGESDEYVLGAGGGQTMLVHVTSVEKNAVFTVMGPRGERDTLADEVTDWSGELPRSGDYVIQVAPTRGNATYTLEVTIR